MKDKIELGDRVKDKISGSEGIAIGITDWLFGCRRISIQPETHKDGKPAESFCIDEPQCILRKKSVMEKFVPAGDAIPLEERKHGNRPDVSPRIDVKR